jgi:hypothetical protein
MIDTARSAIHAFCHGFLVGSESFVDGIVSHGPVKFDAIKRDIIGRAEFHDVPPIRKRLIADKNPFLVGYTGTYISNDRF